MSGLSLDGARTIALTDRWFRYSMPYVFHKLTDVDVGRHKHVFLPLNRNYKPLGQISREHVRYEDYVDQAIVFSVDPATYTHVWTAIHDDKLWLYSDAPASRIDYFERFGWLMSRKLRIVGKVMHRDQRRPTPYLPVRASAPPIA